MVVNLGRPGAIPPAVDAAHVAALIPGQAYLTVPDAIHDELAASVASLRGALPPP